jgi:enamine deaminase RidA (YjgF/YER057c/UK114 family)
MRSGAGRILIFIPGWPSRLVDAVRRRLFSPRVARFHRQAAVRRLVSTENPEELFMSSIKRVNVEKRLSDMAIYNGVAYLAGQVPDDASLDITGQTQQVLATIDRLLAEAGTDKTKILMAQIFITNMKEFDGMNKAWDAWVAAGNTPPRATVEARLANPDYKVEIVVTAAVA